MLQKVIIVIHVLFPVTIVKPVHFASLTQLTNKSTASFNKIVDSSEGPVLCLAGQKLLHDLGWFFRF